jgi:hypothetical protein
MIVDFSVGKRLDLTGVKAKPFSNKISHTSKPVSRMRVSVSIFRGIHCCRAKWRHMCTDGFGTTELDSGQPVKRTPFFLIGSVTKSMTTLCVHTCNRRQLYHSRYPHYHAQLNSWILGTLDLPHSQTAHLLFHIFDIKL